MLGGGAREAGSAPGQEAGPFAVVHTTIGDQIASRNVHPVSWAIFLGGALGAYLVDDELGLAWGGC